MIYDTLKNGGIYHSVHSEFKKAFTFLRGKNLLTLPIGKYKIGRKGTFALVQEYSTREESEGFIECHRKYIDIQYLSKGIEKVGVCAKSECTPMIPYDAEKDFQKLKGKVENREAFLRAIQAIEPTRRRNGASDWRVFRDLAEDGRFVERFVITSWAEYVRLRVRMTVSDRQIHEHVGQFQQPGVEIRISRLIGTTSRDAFPVTGDAASS